MRFCRSVLVLSTILVAVAVAALPGCGSDSDEAGGEKGGKGGAGGKSPKAGVGGKGPEGGAGGTPEAAGSFGVGGDGGANGTCNPTSSDEPDDDFADTNCDGIDGDASHAVFVAPTGKDDAPATRSAPVATLKRAIELAAAKNYAVYACNGIYRENVVISGGLSVIGGYDCERDWLRSKERAIVQPESGVPLVIDSGVESVWLDSIAFRAPDANKPSGSSQAAGIANSKDVTLSNVELSAGNGSAGIDGTTGADAPSGLPATGADGEDTTRTECQVQQPESDLCLRYAWGGDSVSNTCAYDGGTFETQGGHGGEGRNLLLDRFPSRCLIGGLSPHAGEFGLYRFGGATLWNTSYTNASGADGANGPGASRGIGSVVGLLYVADNKGSAGKWGRPGSPGQGGYGGPSAVPSSEPVCQSLFTPGSGGGQGGPGGCGGGPGSGGEAGGGSIALVSINSGLTILSSRVITSSGGLGGRGSLGGRGQPGGFGGDPGAAPVAFMGFRGQSGGMGGKGGSGGPGGGGPSIGILCVGSCPTMTDTTFALGVPGAAGAGVGGLVAKNGVKAETHELVAE